MKRFVSILGLLAVGMGIGWYCRGVLADGRELVVDAHPGSEAAGERASTAPPVQVAQLDQAGGVREALPAGSMGEVTPQPLPSPPTVADAFFGLERLLFTHPHYDTNDSELLQKYEGCSLEQMRVAVSILSRSVATERTNIIAQRMKDGLFTTQVVAEGEKLPEALASSNGRPVSVGWEAEPSNGFVTYKIAQIPPDEYPEFNDMQVEAWWLTGHLVHLGMPLDDLR